jgi:hypothetical protein
MLLVDALGKPYKGLTFQLKDKDWYLTDDDCAVNPICSHADNAKGVNIKPHIVPQTRSRHGAVSSTLPAPGCWQKQGYPCTPASNGEKIAGASADLRPVRHDQ